MEWSWPDQRVGSSLPVERVSVPPRQTIWAATMTLFMDTIRLAWHRICLQCTVLIMALRSRTLLWELLSLNDYSPDVTWLFRWEPQPSIGSAITKGVVYNHLTAITSAVCCIWRCREVETSGNGSGLESARHNRCSFLHKAYVSLSCPICVHWSKAADHFGVEPWAAGTGPWRPWNC